MDKGNKITSFIYLSIQHFYKKAKYQVSIMEYLLYFSKQGVL
nr:MAG TPA: hypothetical protein [Caudoviricetes sp.]